MKLKNLFERMLQNRNLKPDEKKLQDQIQKINNDAWIIAYNDPNTIYKYEIRGLKLQFGHRNKKFKEIKELKTFIDNYKESRWQH